MKILFVGWHNPAFTSITEYIEMALAGLGHCIEKFDYRQFSIPGRIREKAPFLERYDINRINRKLIKRAETLRPDLLFVLQGTTILPETIIAIKNKYGITSINWFIDYPGALGCSLTLAKYYDYFFVSNSYALGKHYHCGNRAVRLLNFACFPDIHQQLELNQAEKQLYGNDVVFVGSRHSAREAILNSIQEFNLGIWGPGWNDLGRDSPLRKFYKGGAVGPEIWVKIYNASRIILNINYGFGELAEEDTNPGSTKLFEIPACAGFQLVDAKGAISDIFEDKKHLVVFSDTIDLKDKIKYYLAHPEERKVIAIEGKREVLAKHTYEQRMKEMLSYIKP